MENTMLWSEIVIQASGKQDETMVNNSTVDMTKSDDDDKPSDDDDKDKDKDGAATFALAGATMAAAAFMF